MCTGMGSEFIKYAKTNNGHENQLRAKRKRPLGGDFLDIYKFLLFNNTFI